MNRRHFASRIILGGSALGIALAQSVRRVGALLPLADDEFGRSRLGVFQRKLDELTRVIIDARFAGEDPAAIQRYASDLVGAKPNALFAVGTAATKALLRETQTIPIVSFRSRTW